MSDSFFLVALDKLATVSELLSSHFNMSDSEQIPLVTLDKRATMRDMSDSLMIQANSSKKQVICSKK